MATQLTDLASIEAIIKEMTVEEKAACITGGAPFYSREMEKYGIPALLLLDGGTGFNKGQKSLDDLFQLYKAKRAAEGNPIDDEEFTSGMGGMMVAMSDPELMKDAMESMMDPAKSKETKDAYGCYPPGMFFGATWNPDVIEECGHALGKEANVLGIDILLGTPNVNIHRDPLNGRLFEGYSEDPCLVSKLAPSFVKGVQDEGVIADVKHFAANNQETDRMGVNEHIPERALREIYFPGFQACVDAGCKTVMSSYNQINGRPSAMNSWLLGDVLRKEWGFDGFVVSDWSAAYDQAVACDAGNDLVMPGPRQLSPVINAVKEGRLSEEKLDACVRNFLKVVLDSPAMKGRKTEFDMAEGLQAAYDAAKEGITLLKNDGILPLSKEKKLSYFGERSKKMVDSGAGSAQVATCLSTNLFDESAAKIGAEHVTFEEVTNDTDVIIVTIGGNGQEGADRPNMEMEPDDRAALDRALKAAESYGKPVIAVLNTSAPIAMADWVEKVSAVLCLYLPGMQGGKAAADILFGEVNPSGKLPLTFPKKYSDCPSYRNFPGYNMEVWYGEGIYVGYRYYDLKGIEVQYPFGYGLSYTTFAITGASVPEHVNVDEETVKVRVTVKNTGDRAGAEVVQLYVHDVESTLDKPYKELKAFAKVYLEAGEEKEVELTLKKHDFESYDCRMGCWTCEPGAYELLIGNSSANILQTVTVDVTCENPYGYGPYTDIVKVVSNPRATEILKELTGVDLKTSAGTYLVFEPKAPFKKIWETCVAPALGGDAQKEQEILEKLYQEWKTL